MLCCQLQKTRDKNKDSKELQKVSAHENKTGKHSLQPIHSEFVGTWFFVHRISLLKMAVSTISDYDNPTTMTKTAMTMLMVVDVADEDDD